MTAQTLTLVPDRSSDTASTPRSLSPTIPTALITDSPRLRSGLQHILQGTQFDLTDAVSAAGSRRLRYFSPELALVIVEVNQNTGRLREIVKQVRERSPETRVVTLADQFDLEMVRLGHEAGVNGFCLAAIAPEVLLKSLELVMLGESVLPCGVLRSIMDWAPEAGRQPVQDTKVAGSKLSELAACKLSARESGNPEMLDEGRVQQGHRPQIGHYGSHHQGPCQSHPAEDWRSQSHPSCDVGVSARGSKRWNIGKWLR